MHNLHIIFKILLCISSTVLSFKKHTHTNKTEKIPLTCKSRQNFHWKVNCAALKLFQSFYAGVNRINDLHVQCY